MFYTEMLTWEVYVFEFFFTLFSLVKNGHKSTFINKNFSIENSYILCQMIDLGNIAELQKSNFHVQGCDLRICLYVLDIHKYALHLTLLSIAECKPI